MTRIRKLVTHSGTFHADEVFACAVVAGIYRHAELIRTRDPLVTAGGPDMIVFDVGGVYDPELRIFDHHQADRPRREDGSLYSAAGLIWKHYGRDFLGYAVRGHLVDEAWEKVDRSLIRRIDQIDNGVIETAPFDFAELVDDFNGDWMSDEGQVAEDERFREAVQFAARILDRHVDKTVAAIMAKEKVREAARAAADPRIVELPASMPWESVILKEFPEVLYVIYPRGEEWLCVAVPPEKGSMLQKAPLPESWAGLRDVDLCKETGVDDAIFVHPNRFICGAHTPFGIKELARLSLERSIEMTPTAG